MQDEYELIDSGNGRKLERFGKYVLVRPAAGAVWEPSQPESAWDRADAWFDRDGGNNWSIRNPLPPAWNITVCDMVFKLNTTDFGHLGIFPEQKSSWKTIDQLIRAARAQQPGEIAVLNLFAYSGGSTMAASRAGASVCHLDASKGMVARARENAGLNQLETNPIRWIVEDVGKFLDRECRRERRYAGIVLDPPSFGRGKDGEVFKIERDLGPLLKKCRALLTPQPLFILLSCHTAAYTPIAMKNLLGQVMCDHGGSIEAGELLLTGSTPGVMPLPSGTYAMWKCS